jgi:hypothetical protein
MSHKVQPNGDFLGCPTHDTGLRNDLTTRRRCRP